MPVPGPVARPPHVVATLTSFNRRDKTLQCLAALQAAAAQAGAWLDAVLVDDGSTDGTAQAVVERFAWVRVLQADGSLYWTQGMHRAVQAVLDGLPDADYILWLNDDTVLLPEALATLLSTAVDQQRQHGKPVAVVGATVDAATGQLTYSGQVSRGSWRRFSYHKLYPGGQAIPCETMNGNVVLLPLALVRRVGNLDPAFAHAGGDIDYGLRVREAGLPLMLAPGVCGHCSVNPAAGGFTDATAPLGQRWRHMLSRKGLPVGTWLPLTRKHGGALWPLYFAWPYLKVLGSSSAAALRRRLPKL